MPGLVLFKRRWAIASDDFVFPSITELSLRFVWLVALIIIYVTHQYNFDCGNGNIMRNFYIGTIVLDSLGIIITIFLLSISMQGTIQDNWPRRNISWCLYAKLFLLLPEAVWVCLSTYWMFGHHFTCSWTVVWTAKGTVLCTWLVGILTFIGILVVFDPLGTAKQRTVVRMTLTSEGSGSFMVGGSSAHKLWENRCRLLCCCIACHSDTQEAFTEVGKIVANFFQDLDLVPTDIAAGLMLVLQQQQEAEVSLSEVRIVNSGPSGSRTAVDLISAGSEQQPTPKIWMTIPNLAYYMRYAMGSYGWPLYVYSNLCTGLCRLCCKCKCCACIRGTSCIYSDNICNCNTAAIKKWADVVDENLIYVSFHNTFKQVPFFVTIDYSKNVAVIGIRGTMSLKDGLADLSAKGAKLDIPGVENAYCHEAMLDCAHYILEQLSAQNILEKAFGKLQEGAGLVVTGHSLGAGVAAILAILLRPNYPSLMCFAFSPPGGLLSPSASKYTQEFVCSTAVGKDLVPRLGMFTLTDLKVKILRAVLRCNMPKYQILATGCLRLLCCNNTPQGAEQSERSLLGSRRERCYSTNNQCTIQDSLRACEANLEAVTRNQWPLNPPGQFLHVVDVKEESSGCCGGQPVYQAYWTDVSVFNKILLSHKMLSDHLPNVVLAALEQLVDRNVQPAQPVEVS
ncbi:Sn1-specific diacylglycerol lipase beta [Plakobranchus ocellatus]|uniref:sn-1-specific diacylglycerol lipase n=1 Tax=Plakobranchus ocellatus TaxID=259542 RepID=A0AAV3ZWE1_9GAST|nr:Sn1-specific diacylglycerol lipase beta [Plakobranchus ocellatus]